MLTRHPYLQIRVNFLLAFTTPESARIRGFKYQCTHALLPYLQICKHASVPPNTKASFGTTPQVVHIMYRYIHIYYIQSRPPCPPPPQDVLIPPNKRHSWRWRMQLPTNFAHFPPKDISGGTTRHNLLLTATASGNCRSLKSSDPSAFRPPGYLLRLEFAACLHLPVPRQFRRVRLECAAEKRAESSAS